MRLMVVKRPEGRLCLAPQAAQLDRWFITLSWAKQTPSVLRSPLRRIVSLHESATTGVSHDPVYQ
jgi:hypothetical protein